MTAVVRSGSCSFTTSSSSRVSSQSWGFIAVGYVPGPYALVGLASAPADVSAKS